jgi:hypothetical protein
MEMRFLLGLMLLSVPVFASDWNDLETGETYKIKQSLSLTQLERSSSKLDILQGESFKLNTITGLDMISVTMLTFAYEKCPGMEMKTELEIIPVLNASPTVEIGATVEDCELQIFLENKDLMTPSFFE